MPLVSVVIPTRDRRDLVRRAVDSVLAQTHQEIELIVVDDASEDDTVDVLRSYDDPRLLIVRRDAPSGGASTPRNEGMARSRGDWIAFCDSDDEWLPDKLTLQLAAAPPSTALVYSRCEEIHVSGPSTVYPTRESTPVLHEGDCVEPLLEHNFVATSTMMVARSWAQRVGDFNPRMVGSEDWEYCVRVALAGGAFAAVDAITAAYHFHDQNISYRIDWPSADLTMYRAIRPIAGRHGATVDRRIREEQQGVRRARYRSVIRWLRHPAPAPVTS